jgi:HD-like signal output (HDOD) protein
MTPLFLLAGTGALLLAILGWWRVRRRSPVAVPIGEGSSRRDAPGAHDSASSVPALHAEAPEARALLRRLHAVAFDDASEDEVAADASVHDEVAAEAAALLAGIDSQPRYTPRRPQLLPQLMRAANDPDASLSGIARIIGQDPTLSANLLRIANSPFYRVSKRPVESVERAVTLLGLDGLRPVIAAALVQPVMRTGDGPFGRLPGLVWDHTLLSAAAAAEHARRVEQEDAFAAQLLGLLHGLGAIIVVHVLRDQYARRPGLVPDRVLTTAMLDAWAAPTAHRIANSWGLSGRIGEALDAQQPDAIPSEPLGRALRVGRIAGALALLCRLGRFDDAEGLAMLSALDVGDGRVLDARGLWERLRT